MKRLGPIAVVASTLALAAVLGALLSSSVLADDTDVTLAAPPGSNATGEAELQLVGGVLSGTITAENLPAQPYGSGHFIVGWFVRTDTGDKAFLGPLIHDKSIVLASGGSGTVNFAATHFTTGPNAGSAIGFGPSGKNLIIVLIENNINGLTPSPVGVAVSGTF